MRMKAIRWTKAERFFGAAIRRTPCESILFWCGCRFGLDPQHLCAKHRGGWTQQVHIGPKVPVCLDRPLWLQSAPINTALSLSKTAKATILALKGKRRQGESS